MLVSHVCRQVFCYCFSNVLHVIFYKQDKNRTNLSVPQVYLETMIKFYVVFMGMYLRNLIIYVLN